MEVENFENLLLELCELCSQNKQSLLGKIGMKQAKLIEMFKKEHKEAEDLFQEFVKNGERETVRRVAHAIVDTYKQCINLVDKHLKG